jgi:hypothetical protein
MSSDPETTQPARSDFYGGYQVYSESGIDLTLLRENLKRRVEDRIERNGQAARLVEALRGTSGSTSVVEAANRGGPGMFDPSALLRRFVEHQAKFVLIGGLAMAAHGSAYVTRDLDICYSRAPENLEAVVSALASLHPSLRGAPPGRPFRLDASAIRAGLNFTLTTDLGDVDLIGEVQGIGSYEQVLEQSEEKTVFGLSIRILSLDGLIAAK